MDENMSRNYAIAYTNVKAGELRSALKNINDIPLAWNEFVKNMINNLDILIDKLTEEERSLWVNMETK